MENSKTKERSVNYTNEENLHFTNLIEKYKDIMFCKKTDNLSNLKKTQAWVAIQAEFNASASQPRTIRQLRLKFDNMKRNYRMHVTPEKAPRFKTCGEVKQFVEEIIAQTDKVKSSQTSQRNTNIQQSNENIAGTVSHPPYENVLDRLPADLQRTPMSKTLRKLYTTFKKDRKQRKEIGNMIMKHMHEKRKQEIELYELKRRQLEQEMSLIENKKIASYIHILFQQRSMETHSIL